MAGEKPVILPPIEFTAGGDNDEIRAANLQNSQNIPGYADATLLVADAIHRRSDTVMMDFTANGVAMKYQIDGIWHDVPPRDRQSGDAMLASLKCLASLNPNERRAKQKGTFKIKYLKAKGPCTLTSQGVQTGERVLLEVAGEPQPLETLEDLGMREKMRQQFKELIDSDTGFIIVSALPKGGLTTAWNACLSASDRFIRDFVAVQREDFEDPEVININPTTYNAAAGATPATILPQLMLKEPDALAVPEVPDAATATKLCELVTNEGKMVVIRLHAKRAEEALLRVLMLKAPADKFAKAVTAVVNVRLVRKLCDACKQPYQPTPQMLAQLGIPAGRVQHFCRPWQPPPQPQVDAKGNPVEVQICEQCNGLGFRGRTALFELLIVNDRMREALVKQPKLEVLHQIARESGHVSLQEEGILLVCQGITALPELQRVLKQ